MTVEITGTSLTRAEVLRVARQAEPVLLDAETAKAMSATHDVVERALARADHVYGLSTAVGVLKRASVAGESAAARYSSRMLRYHRVGQGPAADVDLVRATMVCLANELATGFPGVRPLLVQRLVDALNAGAVPRMRTLGSIGQADLAPLADLADELFDGVPLAAGEGLALLGNNAFSTAAATLATADAECLLDSLACSGALSLEALVATRPPTRRPSRRSSPARAAASPSLATPRPRTRTPSSSARTRPTSSTWPR